LDASGNAAFTKSLARRDNLKQCGDQGDQFARGLKNRSIRTATARATVWMNNTAIWNFFTAADRARHALRARHRSETSVTKTEMHMTARGVAAQ
jgi:hypothetical protein